MNTRIVARILGGAALAVLMGGCVAPVGYPAYPVAAYGDVYYNGSVPAPVSVYPVAVPVPVVTTYPVYRPYVAPAPVYRPPAVYNPNFIVPKPVIRAPSFRR